MSDPADPYFDPWCVYLIYCEDFAKIGVSPFPENRVKQLQTGCPYPLELAGYMVAGTQREACAIESRLHARCKHVHARGEWFWAETAYKAFSFEQARIRITS